MTRTESKKYVSLIATKRDVALVAAAVLFLAGSEEPEITGGYLNIAWVVTWWLLSIYWTVYLFIFFVRWLLVYREDSNR